MINTSLTASNKDFKWNQCKPQLGCSNNVTNTEKQKLLNWLSSVLSANFKQLLAKSHCNFTQRPSPLKAKWRQGDTRGGDTYQTDRRLSFTAIAPAARQNGTYSFIQCAGYFSTTSSIRAKIKKETLDSFQHKAYYLSKNRN